jgi:hypothetical protein
MAVAGFGMFLATSTAHAGAVIDNGTVLLGVNDEGHLNIPDGGAPSSGTGTTSVGLRFMPTGAEATAPGCLCEGWGAGIASLGVSGYANVDADGGAVNLAVSSFASTPSTAVSVVTIADGGTPVLKVTHDYHPSVSTNLYEVDVTMENISGDVLGTGATDLRYRRVMDWDIEPTAFAEFVTIGGLPAVNVLLTGDNGFSTADPLGPTFPDFGCGTTTNFTDCGPSDHGALFDFGFPALAAGASQTFKIYYGAAATEDDALVALALVGAEVYSFGQPAVPGGPDLGMPNTFIFAFKGVGGTPLPNPNPTPEPGTFLLLGSGLAGLVAWRVRQRA